MNKLNIGIISALSLMGATTIIVPSAIAATDHGTTPVTPQVFTVNGTVTDDYGNKMANANVSCNGKSVKTNVDGTYSIECTKGSAPIYIEKDGYISEVITEYSFDHPLDVVLTQYVFGIDKTFTITVFDATGNIMPNCSVTLYPDSEIYKKAVRTNGDGKAEVTIRIPDEKGTHVPFTINHANCDPGQQVVKISSVTKEVNLTAQPYQYDVRAFVSKDTPSNYIIMHAHHVFDPSTGQRVLKVSLEANYNSAFDEDNDFTLTFNVGSIQSNPNISSLTGKNFSIDFNSKQVNAAHGTVIEGKDPKRIRVQLSENKLCLDVTIPSSFYDFERQGTIGIHLTGENGYFEPFGHHSSDASTLASNQLSYVRLDEDNTYYQASDNVNPFGNLTWETVTGDKWKVATLEGKDYLGWVGPQYNHGYKVKLAKSKINDKGIYILTKYIQDQMGHWLPDDYMPHFFFDTNQYEEGAYPDKDAQPSKNKLVKHYSPLSGYWMHEFDTTGPQSPFENKQEYDDFFNNDSEAKIYSKNDMMITFVPYGALWGHSGVKEFGFACNLQYKYTGAEWQAWKGSNPTGFEAIPHFEHLASYIRFDTDLNVIPYPTK